MANEIKLGLGPSPEKVTYLFIGEAEGDEGATAWYELDFETSRKIPVKEDSLTGYIYNMVIVPKTFKNQVNYKLDVHINADRRYVIRTGAGTTFSRGLLLSLKKLVADKGPEVFQSPITISVSQGDEKSVFCGVYDPVSREKIIPNWDGSAQLLPFVQEFQKVLGQLVQTKELIDDQELYRQKAREFRDSKKEAIKKIQEPPTKKRRIKATKEE